MNTIDTVMTEITNLRIHIAPVGYEIDRIVLPAKEMRADRVILLVHENVSEDRAVSFYGKITSRLKKANIEVVQEHHNRLDLFEIIKVVKSIILREHKNLILVNLASGSKVQAIGCMMACMMFNDDKNVTPFYVEAKDYPGFSGEPISTGIKSIENVPIYEMQKPEDRHVKALKIIVDNGGRLSKKNMARLAIEKELIIVNAQNKSQATFASLDKNIIYQLETQWNFIRVEKIGRTRWIQITEDGINASKFLL